MKKKVKIGLIVLGALFLIGMASSGDDQTQSTPDQESQEAQENTEKQEEIDESSLSPEEQIRKTIEDQLPGQNNMDTDRLESIEMAKDSTGLYRVEIGFNADDNFSKNMIKTGIESQMSEIYQAIFTKFDNVGEISIGARFPLADAYGNESLKVVYYTTLTKAEADKINWNTSDATLKLRIIPGVWQTDLIHPDFQ